MSPEPAAAPRRRTGGVVLVVVVLALAVVVAVIIVLGRRPSHPDSPGATARQWAEAVVDQRADDAAALECDRSTQGVVRTMELTVASVSGVSTRQVTKQGSGRWRVELSLEPTSTATFTVPVVRRGGRYVVCSD